MLSALAGSTLASGSGKWQDAASDGRAACVISADRLAWTPGGRPAGERHLASGGFFEGASALGEAAGELGGTPF